MKSTTSKIYWSPKTLKFFTQKSVSEGRFSESPEKHRNFVKSLGKNSRVDFPDPFENGLLWDVHKNSVRKGLLGKFKFIMKKASLRPPLLSVHHIAIFREIVIFPSIPKGLIKISRSLYHHNSSLYCFSTPGKSGLVLDDVSRLYWAPSYRFFSKLWSLSYSSSNRD